MQKNRRFTWWKLSTFSLSLLTLFIPRMAAFICAGFQELKTAARLHSLVSAHFSSLSSCHFFPLSWFFSLSGIFTAFQEATFPLIQSPVTCSSLPEHSVSFHKPTQPNPSWTPRLTRNHPLNLNSCIFIWQTISLTDWLGVLRYILAWNSVLFFLDTH